MPKKRSNKKYILLPLLLIAFYFLYTTDLDLTSLGKSTAPPPPTSYLSDSGNISLYFCPSTECETEFVNFLNSATKSIHCALYEISNPKIQEALLQQSQKIEVQAVTDNEYLERFNYSFVKEDSYGLMHNKFCIIDNKKISTGSMNPTLNGVSKNNNNLLLISSSILADNYESEFQEMWNGTFKKGNPVKNPLLTIDKIQIQNYFCPEDHCADHIKEELKKAHSSIYFMTFSFTHEGIANILLLKQQDNLTLQGVMEARQISQYSQYERLKYNQIDVLKDGNKNNMHHKVFIIDEETVITGSFNPTSGGDEKNDENILIIQDKEIAQSFIKEFKKIYAEAESAALNSTKST